MGQVAGFLLDSFVLTQPLCFVAVEPVHVTLYTLVVTMIAVRNTGPDDKPKSSREDRENQVQDVAGAFLLALQDEQFVTHGIPTLGSLSKARS